MWNTRRQVHRPSVADYHHCKHPYRLLPNLHCIPLHMHSKKIKELYAYGGQTSYWPAERANSLLVFHNMFMTVLPLPKTSWLPYINFVLQSSEGLTSPQLDMMMSQHCLEIANCVPEKVFCALEGLTSPQLDMMSQQCLEMANCVPKKAVTREFIDKNISALLNSQKGKEHVESKKRSRDDDFPSHLFAHQPPSQPIILFRKILSKTDPKALTIVGNEVPTFKKEVEDDTREKTENVRVEVYLLHESGSTYIRKAPMGGISLLFGAKLQGVMDSSLGST